MTLKGAQRQQIHWSSQHDQFCQNLDMKDCGLGGTWPLAQQEKLKTKGLKNRVLCASYRPTLEPSCLKLLKNCTSSFFVQANRMVQDTIFCSKKFLCFFSTIHGSSTEVSSTCCGMNEKISNGVEKWAPQEHVWKEKTLLLFLLDVNSRRVKTRWELLQIKVVPFMQKESWITAGTMQSNRWWMQK